LRYHDRWVKGKDDRHIEAFVKYQISIPKAVRERLALRPGQKIALIARAKAR
jgi:hypothetical protein